MATSPKPETVDSESVRAVAGFRSRAVALGTVDCTRNQEGPEVPAAALIKQLLAAIKLVAKLQ